MAGLTLGLASLGNLYKLAGWQLVGDLTGIVAGLLFGLVLLKLCLTPLHAAGSLKDPIIASVSPTFSMTLMILCTYFVAWGMPLPVATIVWLMAVAIHFGLMIFFVLRHLISQPKAWRMIYPRRDSGDQQSICTGARSAAFLDGVGDLCCLVSVCASPVTACAFARSDSTIINHYGSPGLVVSDRLSGQF